MNKMIVFPKICAGHFYEKDEMLSRHLSRTSLQSKKDFIEAANVMQWMIDNSCVGLLGWRYLKTPNDVGGYYYRLCLTSVMHSDEDLAFIRLTFGNEVEVIDEEPDDG